MQDGAGAAALYELLDGLGSVEGALGGGSGDGEGVAAGGDDIALGLHLGGEAGDGMRGEAGELDLETGSGGGGEAALPEGSCEVIGGELVFGVAGGAEDADATGQGLVGYGVDFAGHRDELQ